MSRLTEWWAASRLRSSERKDRRAAQAEAAERVAGWLIDASRNYAMAEGRQPDRSASAMQDDVHPSQILPAILEKVGGDAEVIDLAFKDARIDVLMKRYRRGALRRSDMTDEAMQARYLRWLRRSWASGTGRREV